jgi:YD repeat-containing protein
MSVRSVRAASALIALVSFTLFAPNAIPDPSPRESISRGDFNGDGRPDLLTQPANRGRGVTLQLGNADGTVGESTGWNSDAFGLDWSAQGSRVLVGDFNGDGQSEMFVQSLAKGGTSALIHAGLDGRPSGVAQVIPADLLGWEWSGDRVVPVAGDFDGNGRDEILLQSRDEFGVHYVMLTNESGEFAAHGQGWIEDYLDLRWTAPASALHSGDFNGDGNADLLLQPMDEPRPGHPSDALYALLLADDKGRFEQVSATWGKDAFGADWDPATHELIVRDVDGDRIADVWLRSYSATGTNFLVMGRSSGRFDNADLKWTGTESPETVYSRERAGETIVVVDEPGNSDGKGRDDLDAGDRPSITVMMSNAPSPVAPTDPGTLKGEFSVDPSGTANYRIAIAVPPGVAGMQPDLAFLYSSRAGNGHLGVGWSLSGLSAITRCPATIDQDSLTTMQSITLTQNDKFCLDGQRLLVKGGAVYGANGTQYHTEIASFQRVTATVTNAANGPDSFEVKDKAGLIRTYGTAHGIDARIEAAPAKPQALVWALNRISDFNGNYIQYTYAEDTNSGEYRPTQIAYYNKLGTQIGRVEIGYESRPDTRSGYMLTGAKKALTQRAKELRTYDGGTLVSSYRLLYGTSSKSGLSQIASIQRCNVAIGTGGARCLASTSFGWQDGQKGFAPGPLWDTLPDSVVNVKPVDINGNGSMELIYAKNGVWNIKSGYNFGTVETTTTISTSASHLPYALGIDVNADGYQDLAVPHDSNHALGAKWGFYLSTGSGLNGTAAFSVPHEGAHDKKPVVVDVNGDVYPDFVFKKNQQLWVYRNAGGVFSTANSQAIITGSPILGDQDITPIEWDGDGRPDLYINGRNCQSNNSCWNNVGVWRNNGNYSFTKVTGTALKKPILGDVNGDGLTDFIDFETSILKVYTNTGGGWALTNTTQTSNYGDSAQVIDYNEDGKQDILVPRGDDRWHAYYWNESSMSFTDEDTGTPVVDRPSSSMFDFDGNGKADIMYLVSGNGWRVRAQDQHLSGLITHFTDGDHTGYGNAGVKGVQATATFAALAHVYGGHKSDGMGGTGVVAPRTRHFNSPMPVVRFSSLSSGAPNPVFTSYTYSGAKLNQYGRGFLGFREVKANNAGTGIITANTHRQEFPYTGMIEAATQDTPSSNLPLYTQGDIDQAASDLSDLCLYDWETKICQYPPAGTTNSMIQVIPGVRVTSTTSNLSYQSLAEGVFPFVDDSTTDSFELNGGTRYRREVTDFTYGDGWGNPTRIVVTTSDGNGGDAHTTDTVNTYTNDSNTWHLSRLTQASVTTTVPGSGSGTRNSSFTYAAAGANGAGQMTSERVEAGTSLEMSKTYAFDQFGNRITEAVGGNGVTTRTTLFGYDATGRFMTSTTNPLNFVASQTWDGRFGVVVTATDPNGNSVTSTYDPFGRKTQEVGPRPGTARYVLLQLCTQSACTASARGAIWKSTSSDSAGRVSTTEFDMFDREILTRTLDWRTDITRYVNSETAYDERGRAFMKTAPFFDGAPRCWSQVVFDKVNRATQERSPASASECVAGAAGSAPPSNATLGRVVTTAYAVSTVPGFTAQVTTRTDPTMTRTINTWVNSMGRTVRVSEVDDSNQTLATTFQYDAWGNTKAVTDPNGVVRSMTYNARGFKLNMTDPDMGYWQYGYNAFGELISQTDAKNQTVTMNYDPLGRMDSRTEPHGGANATTTWNYDIGGFCLDAAGNASSCSSKGRLISVTGPGPLDTGGTVTESYAYDTFGAVRQTLRTIDGKAFWTTFTLDSEGRASTVKYPDVDNHSSIGAVVHARPNTAFGFGVVTQNIYSRGALTKVTDTGSYAYWTLTDTSDWGAPTQEAFGNGAATVTGYDRALQLPTSIVDTEAGGLAMSQSYVWNLAGNLSRRVDSWSNHAEDFTYDKQHRLKQVVLDAGLPTGPITYTNSYRRLPRLADS